MHHSVLIWRKFMCIIYTHISDYISLILKMHTKVTWMSHFRTNAVSPESLEIPMKHDAMHSRTHTHARRQRDELSHMCVCIYVSHAQVCFHFEWPLKFSLCVPIDCWMVHTMIRRLFSHSFDWTRKKIGISIFEMKMFRTNVWGSINLRLKRCITFILNSRWMAHQLNLSENNAHVQ